VSFFNRDWLRLHLTQGTKYALVGAIATTLDFATFNAIFLTTGIDPRIANALSAPVGLATVFFLNKYFSFRGREGSLGTQLTRFALVYGAAYVFNVLCTALFITLSIHVLHVPLSTLVANASKLLAAGCVVIWNYTLLHSFVFSDRLKSTMVNNE
jgi:putative flippase GtrA